MDSRPGMDEGRPVGLLVAVETEFRPLVALITSAETTTVGGKQVVRGQISGRDVVACMCGVGKTNAAAGAAMLCLRYNPVYIINSGTAGGLGINLKIGDIVLGNEMVYGDVDNRCFQLAFGQVPNNPESFRCDADLTSRVRREIELILGPRGAHVYVGKIASVDSFCATAEAKDELCRRFPELAAVEMEGCAVAQICNQFDIRCVVLRSISDTADSAVDYATFAEQAGRLSAELTAAVLFCV